MGAGIGAIYRVILLPEYISILTIDGIGAIGYRNNSTYTSYLKNWCSFRLFRCKNSELGE